MAVGAINSLKYVDVVVTVAENSGFTSRDIGISSDRIKGLFLVYTDDVYYSPPIIAIGSNNHINVRLTSATQTERNYTIRIFYS